MAGPRGRRKNDRNRDTSLLPPGLDTLDKFERWVVRNAIYFVALKLEAPGKWRREERPTLAQSIEVAHEMRDPFGRGAFIHAVTASGRSVCLDRAAWDRWLKFLEEEGE